jgi:hypothetical protein
MDVVSWRRNKFQTDARVSADGMHLTLPTGSVALRVGGFDPVPYRAPTVEASLCKIDHTGRDNPVLLDGPGRLASRIAGAVYSAGASRWACRKSTAPSAAGKGSTSEPLK